MRLAAAVLSLLVATGTTGASKPIPWTMKGCIVDGTLYAIDKDRASRVKAMGDPIDVAKLEGKFIELGGLLYPGDYFRAGDTPPVVKRACTSADRKAIQYAKAHELRLAGARLAHEGKVDEALKLVDESIQLVQPADCDTFIDRAHLYARKDNLEAAAKDLAILRTRKKCRARGALNWLLLQELGNELRERDAAKLAVDALVLAKASCDADICRPGIAKDLAAARAAAKVK